MSKLKHSFFLFFKLLFLFQKIIVVSAFLKGSVQAFFGRLNRKISISVDKMIEHVAYGLNGRIVVWGLKFKVWIADFHKMGGVWVFVAVYDSGLPDLVGLLF
jgi:hypothetical protein